MSFLLRLAAPRFAPTDGTQSLVPPVELVVGEPGIIHLQGPNGSGKSTLLELCGGWLQPTDGSVEVCGLPASSPRVRGQRVMVRERPALYGALTIADHLDFAARLNGVPVDDGLELASRLGLAPWLSTPARQLSTGTEKKAWLVIATIGEWSIGLFDEPFLGLDDVSVGVVDDLLRQWARQRLVVVSDHTGALRTADRVLRLDARGATEFMHNPDSEESAL